MDNIPENKQEIYHTDRTDALIPIESKDEFFESRDTLTPSNLQEKENNDIKFPQQGELESIRTILYQHSIALQSINDSITQKIKRKRENNQKADNLETIELRTLRKMNTKNAIRRDKDILIRRAIQNMKEAGLRIRDRTILSYVKTIYTIEHKGRHLTTADIVNYRKRNKY